MTNLTSQPTFGIAITLLGYYLGTLLQKKTNIKLLHPMVTSTTAIIAFLLLTNISYENYNIGGKIISYLLGPATVVLAVPLCRQIELLKKHIVAVLTGAILGSVVGIISAWEISVLLHTTPDIALSLVPKSVTTPIAMGIAEQIGGIPALTACIVIITGTIGAILGPKLLDMAGIKHDISKGIAIGAAAHAMGTNRCLEESELQGAMGSISIALVGICTALFAPIIIKYFA